MKIHNVFHINLLSAASEDVDFHRRQVKPPPVITAEGEEEYEVEKIINWEQRKDGLYYQIRWTGYGPHEDTMERAEKIAELEEVMRDFLKEHPDAPTPKTYKPAKGYKRTTGRTASLSIQLPTPLPTQASTTNFFNSACLPSVAAPPSPPRLSPTRPSWLNRATSPSPPWPPTTSGAPSTSPPPRLPLPAS
jgi:hypothetical protein